MMFTVLSNSHRIDLSRLPRLAEEDTPRIQELPRIEEEDEAARESRESRESVPFHISEQPRSPEYEPRETSFSHPRAVEPDTPEPTAPPMAAPEAMPSFVPDPIPQQQPIHENPQRESVNIFASDEEELMAKRSVLIDIQQLELQGIRFTRTWTMEDRIEDMTLELRRHLLMMDERNNVGVMKNGLRLLFTGIEMMNTRMNLLDIEGWSGEACQELDKHDANLSRIYRKYWRRSTSNSPEADIAFSIIGSIGVYHMKRTMARTMLNRGGGGQKAYPSSNHGKRTEKRAFPRSGDARPDTPSSSDEEPPDVAR